MKTEICAFPYEYNERFLYRGRVIDRNNKTDYCFQLKTISSEDSILVAELEDPNTKTTIPYRVASCHDGVVRLLKPINIQNLHCGDIYYRKYSTDHEKIYKLKNFEQEAVVIGTEQEEINILMQKDISKCLMIDDVIYAPTLPPFLGQKENIKYYWIVGKEYLVKSPLFWHELIDQEMVLNNRIVVEKIYST